MATKEAPTRGVPVELDRTRHLRYTLGTIRAIREDETLGDTVLEGDVKVDVLGRFLWYGLKHEDPDLTVEQVEDVVDLQNIPALTEALKVATGGSAGGNGAVPPTKAAGEPAK